MIDNNLLTVAEIASFAPELDTSSYDAPTISGLITQASKSVADYLEYTPLAEDIVGEVKDARITTEGDLLIFPRKVPVISLSSIKIMKGPTELALTLQNNQGETKYNIDYTARHIRYPYSELAYQAAPVFIDFGRLRYQQFYVKLNYRGGWEVSSLPATIKQACLLFFRDLLSNQNNPVGANRLRQGLVEFDFKSGGMYSESKFVTDARRLLNPYRRVG